MSEVSARRCATDNNNSLVEQFLDAMWLERGLSDSTLAAYRSDLKIYIHDLSPRSVLLADTADIHACLGHAGQAQLANRTLARRLSVLRRFYQYLVREGKITTDPTTSINSPGVGRLLPVALSEKDVEALLQAPDSNTPRGLRDRTMLELIYATGCVFRNWYT